MLFNPVSTLKIGANQLIYVSSRNVVFVINKELQGSGEKGLVFTLDSDRQIQACLDFFLLDAIVSKTQLPLKNIKDTFIS